METYFAIVTCRNSQDTIRRALFSIKEQTRTPEQVIVIDDGSTDRTKKIIEDMQKDWPSLHVISNPDLGYDISRVVKNWNSAIKLNRNSGLQKTDYHMIATDDTIYPPDYAKKIISYMDSNPSVAIASGNYSKYRTVMPHGAGRFIRNSFFEKTIWHGYYPEQMGYESAILYEATHHGYDYIVIGDAIFEHIRPLGETHKFYEFGASMRTLGYLPLFAVARFLKYFVTGEVTGRLGAIYMLYHYLTYTPKSVGYDRMYDKNIRQYIRENQVQRLKDIILRFHTKTHKAQ
ncbi:MAG TPA: glycosyltransferase family A protein [Candidatus Nitrosopolaris sp.]|nr:glycosyltransferase family A protein [Candidatus Nitrosopolaris sp.]